MVPPPFPNASFFECPMIIPHTVTGECQIKEENLFSRSAEEREEKPAEEKIEVKK